MCYVSWVSNEKLHAPVTQLPWKLIHHTHRHGWSVPWDYAQKTRETKCTGSRKKTWQTTCTSTLTGLIWYTSRLEDRLMGSQSWGVSGVGWRWGWRELWTKLSSVFMNQTLRPTDDAGPMQYIPLSIGLSLNTEHFFIHIHSYVWHSLAIAHRRCSIYINGRNKSAVSRKMVTSCSTWNLG